MSRTRKVLTTAALAAIAAPAAVSVWSGWVGLGAMAGFGPVDMLPGIGDGFVINTAITLPIGVEAYSAMALGVWLGHLGDQQTQRFARISALAALLIGMAGQAIYHVLIATGTSQAPIGVVIGVACLPVVVLGSAVRWSTCSTPPPTRYRRRPAPGRHQRRNVKTSTWLTLHLLPVLPSRSQPQRQGRLPLPPSSRPPARSGPGSPAWQTAPTAPRPPS